MRDRDHLDSLPAVDARGVEFTEAVTYLVGFAFVLSLALGLLGGGR